MRGSLKVIAIVLVSTMAWPTLTLGEDLQSPAVSDALLTDARSYAADYDVDIDEAVRRLNLQGIIGEIGANIEQNEAETYGGHWIEHTPGFRVVVAFTANQPDLVNRYFAGTGLEAIVETRIVQHTMRQLVQDLERLVEARGSLQFDAELNVFKNAIDVSVLDRDTFTQGAAEQRVALPSTARILVVGGLALPATAMYGGRRLREQPAYGDELCTSGFSVRSESLGRDGLTSAAHCPNNTTYELTGEILNLVSQNSLTGHDEQWHRRSDATFPNKAWDGNPDWRWIIGRRGRTNQSVGDYVCHWGRNTEYGCGDIVSRGSGVCGGGGGYTGIRVHNANNKDLASGGDSGGPWYITEIALGISSCHMWVDGHGYIDASYVAANYVEDGLNVTIKTSP